MPEDLRPLTDEITARLNESLDRIEGFARGLIGDRERFKILHDRLIQLREPSPKVLEMIGAIEVLLRCIDDLEKVLPTAPAS